MSLSIAELVRSTSLEKCFLIAENEFLVGFAFFFDRVADHETMGKRIKISSGYYRYICICQTFLFDKVFGFLHMGQIYANVMLHIPIHTHKYPYIWSTIRSCDTNKHITKNHKNTLSYFDCSNFVLSISSSRVVYLLC